jgi:phosphatidylglycerophosphatase A
MVEGLDGAVGVLVDDGIAAVLACPVKGEV